ncbi:MAG: Hpt domain-containing protein [Fidelibacterota bacterium]
MIFNEDDLLEKVGGLKELMVEMIQIFLADSRPAHDNVRQAIADKDFVNLREHAHAVKGSAMSLSAEEYLSVILDLEKAGYDENPNLDELAIKFDVAYEKLINKFEEILESKK